MSLARRERRGLADLLEALGPEAPTLCAGWDTRDLAAHLVVRERRLDAAPGIAVGAFAGRTERVQDDYTQRPYAELVHLVRTGPGRLSLFAVPGADKLLNTTEYVVHHEDVRRAQPGWAPRRLPDRAQGSLWKAVVARAPLALRSATVGVELVRSDRQDAPFLARSGSPTATLTGEPLELLLYLFGRLDHAVVTVSGDPAAQAALSAADLSV